MEAWQIHLLRLQNYTTFNTKSALDRKNKILQNRITSNAALLFLIFSLKALNEGEKKNTKEQKAKILEVVNDPDLMIKHSCYMINAQPSHVICDFSCFLLVYIHFIDMLLIGYNSEKKIHSETMSKQYAVSCYCVGLLSIWPR